MKKDYYLWFVILFILICICILSYRSGCLDFMQDKPVYNVIQAQEVIK